MPLIKPSFDLYRKGPRFSTVSLASVDRLSNSYCVFNFNPTHYIIASFISVMYSQKSRSSYRYFHCQGASSTSMQHPRLFPCTGYSYPFFKEIQTPKLVSVPELEKDTYLLLENKINSYILIVNNIRSD